MNYPAKGDTIDLLLSAARKAAEESSSVHPEDIAYAMLSAIEHAWPVVTEAHKRFSK